MGTASSVLECSTRYSWLPPIECRSGSVPFGSFGSNPAITGIGTDISFVLTAGLSLLFCSFVQLFCDRLRYHSLRQLFEPLVISFSDQQIIRGLSMSIATLYTSAACTLDAYRYDIVCYLILMTIVSHLSAVLVLRSYTDGQVALAVFRFALVFAQIFFAGLVFSSRLTTTFPTGIPSPSLAMNTTLVLPAVCFQLSDPHSYSGLEKIPPSSHKDVAAFSSYIILAAFYGISIMYTLTHVLTHLFWPGASNDVRQQEERALRWTWLWWLGIIRGTILLVAWILWAWSVVKLYQFRQWMNDSGWMSPQSLQEDNGWTFGQFLSLLLLGAAPLSFMNAWSSFRKQTEEGIPRRSGFFPPPYSESETEMQRLMR